MFDAGKKKKHFLFPLIFQGGGGGPRLRAPTIGLIFLVGGFLFIQKPKRGHKHPVIKTPFFTQNPNILKAAASNL